MSSRRPVPFRNHIHPFAASFSVPGHVVVLRSYIAALLVAALLVGCERPPEPGPGAGGERSRSPANHRASEPTPTPSPTPTDPDRSGDTGQDLVYVRGRVLRSYEITTGRDRRVAKLPSSDAFGAPGSSWIAYLASEEGGAEVDFPTRPQLHLLDPDSGKDVALGPGFTPLFAPGGAHLAYLRPAGKRVCEGEECTGEVRVMVVDLATMARRELLPAGTWGLLAWARDRLFVSDQRDLSTVTAVGLGGDAVEVAIAPGELWGVSPDGSPLLESRPGRVRFLDIGDGGELARGATVSLEGTLAEGLWLQEASVLAVLLERGTRSSRLVRLRPAWRAPRPVPGSEGAVGGIVAAPEGRGLAFVQVVRTDPGRLQATYCRDLTSCRPLFEWVRGVRLLSLD